MMKLKSLVYRLVIAILAATLGAMLFFELPTGWKAMDVLTGSMRPGLPPGTLVIVHSVPYSTLRVGDVITYKSLIEPGKLVTHRIVQVKSVGHGISAFIVKGDANKVADPEIVAGQVVGELVFHFPYAGRLFNYSHSPLGLGLLVILPGFVIISYEIELLVKSLKTPEAVIPVPSPLIAGTSPALTRRRALDGIAVRPLLILLLTISAIGLFGLGSTRANLTSNKVSLINNRLVTASPVPSPSGCPGTVTITNTGPHSTNIVTCTSSNSSSTTNTNNVNVTSTNTQSATGGIASNSNSSVTNVTVSKY